MTAPLEGCPRRVEFAVPSEDPDGPRIVAAPGYPLFLEGPTTRGKRMALRVEPDEIPALIDVLREAREIAELPFVTPRRPTA